MHRSTLVYSSALAQVEGTTKRVLRVLVACVRRKLQVGIPTRPILRHSSALQQAHRVATRRLSGATVRKLSEEGGALARLRLQHHFISYACILVRFGRVTKQHTAQQPKRQRCPKSMATCAGFHAATLGECRSQCG